MKKVSSIISLSLIALLFFSACKKENLCDCFKSTGKDITISRDLSPFDTLVVYDKVDVYIKEDATFSVKIVGGKNVVNLIKTEVSDGKLTIRNNNRCNFVRSYKRKIKVYVSMPKVTWIKHSGLGNVYSDGQLKTDTIAYQIFNSGDVNLDVQNVYLRGAVHGMGDVHLSGTTNYHLTNIKGEGFIYAADLITNTSDLVVNTSGETRINVNGTLIAHLYGSGNTYYKGSPAVIQKTVHGSGQLIAEQ